VPAAAKETAGLSALDKDKTPKPSAHKTKPISLREIEIKIPYASLLPRVLYGLAVKF
jgi:hypothetical protein